MLTAGDLLREGTLDPDAVAVEIGGVDPDSVPVRLAPWWVRATWPRGIVASAPPWVIWADPKVMTWAPERRAALMLHELTHIWQWRRMGIASYLYDYLGDYFRGRLRGQVHREAYRAIALEQEANAVRDRLLETLSGA